MELLLLLLFLQVSSSFKHSMKVFFTASSGLPSFPEVVAVIQINDVETGYCDSELRTAVPKQDWMEDLIAGDPKYWEWYAGECKNHQLFFTEQFRLLKKRLNQTDSVHILQRVTTCEWDDETDEVVGTHMYGYDGEDFIAFDLKTKTWVAPRPESFHTKLLWDRDTMKNSFCADFVSQVCVTCLKKNLHYGGHALLRTELPNVTLLQRTPYWPVTCHATGFYPGRAVMFWRKDEERLREGVRYDEILPNHDSTFQMSADVNLTAVGREDWPRYSCVFRLAGAKRDIVTRLDPQAVRTNWVPRGGPAGAAVGSVLGVVLVLCIAAVVIWKKSWRFCGDFQPANAFDLPSPAE